MARISLARGLLAGASVLTLGISAGVDPAAAQATGDEEIIVTAQRRAESLQDVPIAIDAFSQEAIEQDGITGLEDITGRSAGVFFRPVNSAMPNIFVRGIGSTQADNTSEQSVGIFQDEVYLARHSGSSTELFDVARIEVLKGPQGTLYGRNTIGGAINVITSEPTDTFEGYLGAALGNYEARAVRGAISGPLANGVAGRLAFITNQREGFAENPITGVDANDADTIAARGRLRFEPSSALTLNLSVDGTRDRAGPYEAKLLGTLTLAGVNQSDPFPGQMFTTSANYLGHQNRDIWGASLRADYDINTALTLTSITAYRSVESDMARDLDNGPQPILASIEQEEGTQTSQELRLSYDGGGALRVIGGLYYFTEESQRHETWRLLFANLVGGVQTGGIGPGAIRGDYTWDVDVEAESYAAFAQVDIDLSESLTLTLGARYSHDQKSSAYDVYSVGAVAPVVSFIENEAADEVPGTPGVQYTNNAENEDFTAQASESWNSFDPSVTLSWDVSEDAMLYASYREGFKSGGFQARARSPSFARDSYDPESVSAYEVGARTDWLDGQFRANFSAFRYDYVDLQQINLVQGTTITFTDNVGEAQIDGAELELTAHPTDALEVSVAYTYLDGQIVEYIDANGANFSGNTLPRAPRNAFNFTTQYNFPMTSWGQIMLRGEYNWRDEMFFLAQNRTIDFAPDVGIFNARITLLAPGESWRFAIYGSNLSDEAYCANYSNSTPPEAAGNCAVGAPMELGASILVNF